MTDQTTGAAKSAFGEVQNAVGDLANEAANSVQSAYGNAKEIVRQRPITGIAIGVGLGLLLAHLLGGQKTVYIRERPRNPS